MICSASRPQPRDTATRSTHPAQWSDEQLLQAYREHGDQRLFATLVARYEQEIYTYLVRYLGDRHLADEVFQHSFLQLHLKCRQFGEGRRLRPWLYAIATNQAIDALRRERRHQHGSLDKLRNSESEDAVSLAHILASPLPSPGQEFLAGEDRTRVDEAVQRLPAHLRCVVWLVYYQGLKFREAADALQIPVGTLKSRMHQALNKLSERLAEPGRHRAVKAPLA